jgi:predicted TIM-barrel fold metal-dependent hydrolase
MAIKFDIPVFIHPTLRKNLWGGEKYDLFLTASREYDLAKSFVEIIYGVLPRYPELKVLMSHLGGGLPALKGRFLAKHQPDDFPLPPEERGQWLTVNQAKALGLVENFDSLLKNFCFDSAGYGGWVPIMKFALEVLGSDHVCFGTDYPFEFKNPNDVRKYITDIKDMGASGRDQEKSFSPPHRGRWKSDGLQGWGRVGELGDTHATSRAKVFCSMWEGNLGGCS